MRNILTVAKLIVLLNVRKGTLWGVLFLMAGTSSFIFLVSTGDNVLINELKLRIQYSYTITYSLLTLIVIAISCYTIRSQIDGRQMHMLTSFPLSRLQIWLGKWLGLISIAILAELTLSLSLVICSYFFSRSYSVDEIQTAKNFFNTIKYEVFPIEVPLERRTEERIQELILEKKLIPEQVNNELRKRLFEKLRKDDQLIPPLGEKTWHFNLKEKPVYGDHIELKFKFYTESRRKHVDGDWLLTAAGEIVSFTSEFSVLPFTFNTIKIPLAQIPESGKFNITLKARNMSDLIVGRKAGIRIYYEDGPLVNNIMKAFLLQVFHLAVTASVGLTTGVAFTFSVASFLSIVLYFLSVSSTFFIGIARELTYGYHASAVDHIAALIIKSGTWLVKGLQPPAVIPLLSSSISIPVSELVLTWFPAIFIYGVVVALLGIYLLTQKELDKIVTQL